MTEHSNHSASEENLSRTLLSNAPRRAILVGIDLPNNDWPVEEALDELERLALTAGVTCIDRVIQRLAHPHPGTLLGSGKLQEIAELVKFYECDGVIFDLELTHRQHRNLENTLEAQVLDRTALILIIFGQRAHTREGRLQVELAQIEYDLPRLARQWSHLSRQKGSVQQRGEGEKQIEVDRRLLRRQQDQLEEEVAEADLLVHVVDASSPSMHKQIEAVEQVLEEIGAGGRPTVLALNKIDVLPCDVTLQLEGMAATLPLARVSALQGDGIDDLLHCISENLLLQFTALEVLIPYDRGELVALFHKYGTIENESYEESGTRLRGYMPGNHSGPFTSLQNVLPQSAQVRHTTRKIK